MIGSVTERVTSVPQVGAEDDQFEIVERGLYVM